MDAEPQRGCISVMNQSRRGFVVSIFVSILSFFGWKRDEVGSSIETTTMRNGTYRTYSSPAKAAVDQPLSRFIDGPQVRETEEFKTFCKMLGCTPFESIRLELDYAFVDGEEIAKCGYSLYRTPEFQALCERLGVRWELYTRWLEISFRNGELPTVTHNYALYK